LRRRIFTVKEISTVPINNDFDVSIFIEYSQSRLFTTILESFDSNIYLVIAL